MSFSWLLCFSEARALQDRLNVNHMMNASKVQEGKALRLGPHWTEKWSAVTWSSIRCLLLNHFPTEQSHCKLTVIFLTESTLSFISKNALIHTSRGSFLPFDLMTSSGPSGNLLIEWNEFSKVIQIKLSDLNSF